MTNRYAYIKNGDAVEQVQRLVPLQDAGPTSGPDAFVYSFLRSIGDSPVLLLSRSSSAMQLEHGNIRAQVFKVNGNIVNRVILKFLSEFRVLFSLLQFKPDRIICGTTGGPLWVSYLVSKIYGIPLVHSRHNRVIHESRDWFRRLRSALDIWVIKKLPSVMVHGPYLKDQLNLIGVSSKRIVEFDIGFEDMLKQVEESSSKYLPDGLEGRKIILYMGRIEKDKGVLDLLEASKEQLIKNADIILVYAGEGSCKNTLIKEVESENINAQVKMLGYVSHDHLVELLSKSFLLITPTQGDFMEGRCMSAMEGLVMGVPVIAPDFGPFPYLIKHGVNGFLYETNSVEDLKKRINCALKDNVLYSNLCLGAKETSKKLLRPKLTFGEAAKHAFLL